MKLERIHSSGETYEFCFYAFVVDSQNLNSLRKQKTAGLTCQGPYDS